MHRGTAGATLLAISAVAAACGGNGGSEETTRPEQYRNQYHFSPLEGWMNDPNGLVYHDGEYHLFFQHNPYLAFFGEIHWGHAVSTDLVHWEPLDLAIAPDPQLGLAFSGSAIMASGASRQAVCGPGSDPCMVAALTHHGGDDGTQKQSLAYSTDRGRTFTMYDGNPVLANQGVDDFRDPKVLWHEPTERWIMALAVHDDVELYGSADLVAWSLLSRYSPPGAGDGELECPELFELPITGRTADTRWVLKVDRNRGFRDGSPAAEYVIGSFDGTSFSPDGDVARLIDHGSDFYAAQSWSDVPDDRRIWIAWMNNWSYALSLPTEGWRGSMTVPRTVSLVDDGGVVSLVQTPVEELTALRVETLASDMDRLVDGTETMNARGRQLEVRTTIAPALGAKAGMRVRVGADQSTEIAYDRATQTLYVDRTVAGASDVSDELPVRFTAPIRPAVDELDVIIYVDESSVEVFADGGRVVISARIFPNTESTGIELFSEGGPSDLKALSVHRLGSIWNRR